MAENVSSELQEELFSHLQGEKIVLLATVDHETGAPNVTAISWLIATDPKTLRFAIDPRSRVVQNIQKDRRVTVTVMGAGSVFAISGQASVEKENMQGVSLKMVRAEIAVDEVREIMFYGGKLTVEPAYEKTYDPKLAEKFDTEVYTALRKA
jgi:predicted pyridoxine 5'-phosphate oxidase superfamily flavin-nucleotide-binding protein